MPGDFQVSGDNAAALFTLKLHRSEGMLLLAMNWKDGPPPADFVGFGIEYKEPAGDRFYALNNRLTFATADGSVPTTALSSLLSPIQKFRWVHFPRNAELPGAFTYRVTPVFMNAQDQLSYGEAQVGDIELQRDTWPGQLNVTFTRGYVSSQAFVERYAKDDRNLVTLLPRKADDGLDFVPTHADAQAALQWMGFEAREAILAVLDQAVSDSDAQVKVIAYDLNEPNVVSRLEKLGSRLQIIIDDSSGHGAADSAESQAAARLAQAGATVKREHMGSLQHNKVILLDGSTAKTVVCGSTNFSWRGIYVQANNALVLQGETALQLFQAAFAQYWASPSAREFGALAVAQWHNLGLDNIDAQVTFSPHGQDNAALAGVGSDIATTGSSLLFSLAFLYQTNGPIQAAIKQVAANPAVFVYGISDRQMQEGLDVLLPGGESAILHASALNKQVPAPFQAEPTGLIGGAGVRLHHKFVVIDFDKPTARVYMGSYNFADAADRSNGENLLLIRDRRVAVAYMVEAVRLLDHYHFRVAQESADAGTRSALTLRRPPRQAGESAWWQEDYSDLRKIQDRELFA
ncbi:phospholipase D-like domain-containing protein [Pseudomonas sp. RIT-To-2]|uniref:phospholipase D-like domain-containing protein n=1 Tax=Pseudomonas sp. RIT-To-2 TaxID=3462541 RepID=UPI002413B3E2